MSKTIVILMPNGRRELVNVTPSSLLNPLFADLCKKRGFESDQYVLKSSTGKLIDGTIPFRLTGIPNRAVLETSFCSNQIIGSDTTLTVDVCVQLPDGERLTVKLEDSCPLWDVIERLLEKKPDLLDEEDVEPCLSFMDHTFRGSQALLERTLKNCGISGRALLRFSFASRDFVSEAVSTELDFTSAGNSVINLNSSASKASFNSSPLQLTSSTQDTASPSGQENSPRTEDTNTMEKSPTAHGVMMSGRACNNLPNRISNFSWMPGVLSNCRQMHNNEKLMDYSSENVKTKFADFKFPEKKQSDDEENLFDLRPFSETCVSTSGLVDRQMKVFSLNEVNFEIEDIPDDFFDVTVEDLKTMHKLRQQEVKEMNEQPLMSGNSKKRKILEKYSNSTMIRIIFPDKSALQAKFLLTETAHILYDFVSETLSVNLKLERNCFDFVLFTAPPRSEIKVSELKTLLDLNLYPAVNVHFSSEKISLPPFLKPELLNQKVSPSLVYNLQLKDSTGTKEKRPGLALSSYSTEDSSLATDEESENILKNREITANRARLEHSTRTDASKGSVPKWFTSGLKK